MTAPHAYAVEVVWNVDRPSERWGPATEMRDFSQNLTREEAEALMAKMIAAHVPAEHVRVVAISTLPGDVPSARDSRCPECGHGAPEHVVIGHPAYLCGSDMRWANSRANVPAGDGDTRPTDRDKVRSAIRKAMDWPEPHASQTLHDAARRRLEAAVDAALLAARTSGQPDLPTAATS